MNIENASCTGCFLSSVCSPKLQPERIRASGTISKGALAPVREACRHSSCDEGLEEAWFAKQKPGKHFIVMDWHGQTSHSIMGKAFGSYDKPTEEKELRIVDQQSGAIYSFQDPSYFPTGQFAKISDA